MGKIAVQVSNILQHDNLDACLALLFIAVLCFSWRT